MFNRSAEPRTRAVATQPDRALTARHQKVPPWTFDIHNSQGRLTRLEDREPRAREGFMPSGNFAKIPLFSPGRDSGSQAQVPPARGLGIPIQAKLKLGAVDDPLEHEAERIGEQIMRER